MKRFYCILSIYLLCLCPLFGQATVLENKINDGKNGGTPGALKDAAESAAKEGDHFSAMKYYELALKRDSSEENLFAYATAAEKVFGHTEAISAYQTIISQNLPLAQLAEYKLAGIYYILGRYQEAGELYDKIASTANGELLANAEKASEDCTWASKREESEAKIEHLAEAINSDWSEFAPLMLHDTLYFSSLRFPFVGDKHKPERFIGKVLTNVTKEEKSVTSISSFNKANQFTANTAFNRDGSKMYFTICDYISSGEVQCQIYERALDSLGIWGEPIKLPETINTPGCTNTQPNVGYDRLTGQEVLYFASDRALGGHGERDIWYSNILPNGTYGTATNLAAVNTDKDDITPFYHQNTGVLYYSTNGLRTLGGYDIYRVRGNGLSWSEPDHVAPPINSSSNEIYYTLTDDGFHGYFASNRPGSLYYDTIGCCYDIWHADMFKPEVIVMTLHRETGDAITGTRLRILPISQPNALVNVDGSDFDMDGFQQMLDVELDQAYQVIVDKPGYESDTLIFTTAKEPWKDPRLLKLYLVPSRINLLAYSFDKQTNEALNGTTYEFRDLGLVTADGSLAQVKNEKEAFVQEQLPDTKNEFSQKLEFNHKYSVLVRKGGYTLDSVMVSTEGATKSGTIIKQLYLTQGGLAFDAFAYNSSTGEGLNGVSFRLIETTNSILDQRTIEQGNLFTSLIAYGKSYTVVATKSGFSSDSISFNTLNLSKIDFTKITKKLYLMPEGMFPVIVYFDNDEPTKRSLATTTSKTYGKTYEDYVTRRSEFEHLSPDGEGPISAFFEREVKTGWTKLKSLNQLILKELQSGKIVELEVSGYASPRAATAYNRNLASRRVSSIRNHFRDTDPVFKGFIDANKLRFKIVAQGEDTAAPGISDSIPDEKNSIYTLAASRERRAQITRMNILPR